MYLPYYVNVLSENALATLYNTNYIVIRTASYLVHKYKYVTLPFEWEWKFSSGDLTATRVPNIFIYFIVPEVLMRLSKVDKCLRTIQDIYHTAW